MVYITSSPYNFLIPLYAIYINSQNRILHLNYNSLETHVKKQNVRYQEAISEYVFV